MQYYNYFLNSKNSRLTQGHLKAEELYGKILSHNGETAYCCYFDLDFESLKLEWDTGRVDNEGKKIYEYHLSGNPPSSENLKCNGKTFTKYEGMASPALDCISFDFDADDPQDSLQDVRRFISELELEKDGYILFFSGSKGFHLMIPFNAFDLDESEFLPNQLKDLAKYLKNSFPTLDTAIYNYNRKFRVPFTRHEKSGLYKNVVDPDMEMDQIKAHCLERLDYDFFNDITFNTPINQILAGFLEESKRASYAIDKHKAGDLEKPSPFEKFDDKKCIKKMLESRCDDVGRNNAALRIVNDYYRTGKPQAKCEKDLSEWAVNNELPLSEISEIITNIYQRNANYNFGCQDEIKSSFCTAKCAIWPKLDEDKRPPVVDAPTGSDLKGEFRAVQWLMESIFCSMWNNDKQFFASGSIVKQDANHLFYYKNNHWQYLDEAKIQILKTKINNQFKNKLSVRRLDSIFKLFLLYVPEVPEGVDLFSPRNDMANFMDGTLHLKRKVNGEYKLVFKKHNKEDYCTTIIEQNYEDYLDDPENKNEAFEKWLYEYLEGNQENFNLIQEMFGSSLMPKFPQFFILLGLSGTGKSTVIKVLKKLHKNTNNISGVSPDKFNGFHMHSMVGKLMNIVSDIKTNCRIDDDIVKQVDDQEEVRIEVKRKDDIYTKLPAIHIFGANKMPTTGEGYSGAMKRRVSIINFNKVFTGKRNLEIAKDIFEENPLGVLAFALNGLKRLAENNNGLYTVSSVSQEKVKQWTKSEDIVGFFLEEITDEGIDFNGKINALELNKNYTFSRALLWKIFNAWQEDSSLGSKKLPKNLFFKEISDNGFKFRKTNGIWKVEGLGESFPKNDTI